MRVIARARSANPVDIALDSPCRMAPLFDGVPAAAPRTAHWRIESMAKPMTKSKIVAALAETVDIPKKTSAAYLEALANLAHKEAKNGFTIPGVGKLVVRNYKARMGRNPQTGQEMKIPARRRLKFVVAKAAKDAALGAAK
jgi:DNA-binding protein HU-beta